MSRDAGTPNAGPLTLCSSFSFVIILVGLFVANLVVFPRKMLNPDNMVF